MTSHCSLRIDVENRPGTYAVVLLPEGSGPVRIGKLGVLDLIEGCYLYLGSALGPGGVAARCRHHLRIASRPHWHLDYLRPYCRIPGIWAAYGRDRREHRWAAALRALPSARQPLQGFGSSDCDCLTHLIWLPQVPKPGDLGRILGDGCFCWVSIESSA